MKDNEKKEKHSYWANKLALIRTSYQPAYELNQERSAAHAKSMVAYATGEKKDHEKAYNAHCETFHKADGVDRNQIYQFMQEHERFLK